jgi:type I restriction enzyme R subunit
MSLHKEIEFENDICEYLGANGWLYAVGDAQKYDRLHALFPDDLIAWIQETQPTAWDALEKSNGVSVRTVLMDRLRKQLDDRGTLDVLRNGMEMLGLKQPLQLAQIKPALGMNPELQKKYAANRLRVVRQVRYSLHNENAIDLLLFLNGIPVATAELKSDFTQSVDDAVDQYRFDRDPHPKGKSAETLLSFPNGALVHFAVSNSEVRMTTKLQGAETAFLPFNKGDNGGSGNPVNESGHRTAYLWEEVWQRDSWLEIIGRYLIAKRDKKKQITSVIFPRYHQLDATRKLVADVLENGPGQKYLIQHSAGSGKTNSIAWTAHFLAELHDANQQKLFDCVLVVSDRNVLDAQLQEAIFDFQRTKGVVATITGESQSKSGELAMALSGGKKIVVCTIQTFPFALKTVQQLAATEGKRFAVIADEAHSSQTGEAASKLKQLLSAEEIKELADGGEVSVEDLLAAQMAARAKESCITYVAFTATPKSKTLELFGRRPDPSLPAGPKNLPAPFHVYSMRQAIEEGFILDVLRNYTSYDLAFKLASESKVYDESEVERSEAMKGIMRWVRLHPYNISQKVQVVVEHFRENVASLLNGHAKAMVVVGSRLEAVRWQLAIEKYIKSQGYKMGTLVAFSQEVHDPESSPDPLTENSTLLNPNLRGRDIREAFATDEYQVLLVANKYQTGFDQPLLCGMYVDKRLAGIQAVQTLSRLNRAYNGPHGKKDTTYILDFVNDPNEILAAFKTYYETAELAGVTDPYLVYDLRAKLDASGYYDEFEVDRVVEAEMNPNASQKDLVAAVEPVVDRLLKQYKAAREEMRLAISSGNKKAEQDAKNVMNALILFKRNIGTYLRVYTFLSQIFDYGNTAIEKRSIFFKRLLPLLEFGRERDSIDLSGLVLTHHKLKNLGKRNLGLSDGKGEKLQPMTDAGSGEVRDKEKALIAEIIEMVNELFSGDLTDDDKLVYVNQVIKTKLLESDVLVQQSLNNTKEQFANSPDLNTELLNAIIDSFKAHHVMSKQALDSDKVRQGMKAILLGPARLYESLRMRGGMKYESSARAESMAAEDMSSYST